MASDSRRLALVIAAIVVLVGGGALYLFLVVLPGKTMEEAREQIVAWDAKWQAARSCLMGDKPLANDVADAMTVRELMAGTTEAAMGDCTPLVAKLRRPAGPASRVNAVEAAWPELERAAARMAEAYVSHSQAPLSVPNPLPPTLVALEAAYAKLRAAAEMSAPSPTAGPAIPGLTPAALVLDGDPVTELAGVSAGGAFRGMGATAKGEHDVVWTADKGLTGTLAADGGGLRSIPNGTWSVDVAGGAGGATLTAGDKKVTIDTSEGDVSPLLAIGDGAERFVVYVVAGTMKLARSADSGATWAKDAILAAGDVAFTAAPTGDRLQLAWTDPKASPNGLRALDLAPANAKGPLPAPVALAAQDLATWCTAGSLWIVGGTAKGYEVFAGKPPGVPVDISQPRPVACNDQRVILRGSAGIDIVCSATACTPLADTGAQRVVGLVGEHVYRADSRAQILAVWRDDEPVTFFRIPAPRDVFGIVDIGGKPILLLSDPKAYALEQVALP
jgi:hypothetical protein